MAQRVLVLTHPEGDFGGAFLFNGLCQALGEENVYEYPAKLSYRGKTHHYSVYDIVNGMTAPFSWMPAYKAPYDEATRGRDYLADLREKIRSGFFSCVILESMKIVAIEAFAALRSVIKVSGVPVVIHDGDDSYWFPDAVVHVLEDMRPQLILKREYPKNVRGMRTVIGGARVVPFPFSFPNTGLPDAIQTPADKTNAEYDVAVLLGATHPLRQAVVDRVRDTASLKSFARINPDYRKQSEGSFSWREYLEIMHAKARMGISIRGHGFDSCRYWEVPYCAVLVADDVDILLPYRFEHGKHAIIFSHADHCIDLLKEYAHRHEELQQMYLAGRAHLLEHHTNKARIDQLFAYLRGDL